jgi:hypothetical protein
MVTDQKNGKSLQYLLLSKRIHWSVTTSGEPLQTAHVVWGVERSFATSFTKSTLRSKPLYFIGNGTTNRSMIYKSRSIPMVHHHDTVHPKIVVLEYPTYS